MGSTFSHLHVHWVLIASICGVLYLIFDALRSFALQISPVRLRSLSAETENGSTWTYFDVEDFQLVSGALLQIFLVLGVGATTMVFEDDTIGVAVADSVSLWAIVVILWKFVLALVPEDTGEVILRALLPFSRSAYYAFWPVLYPLRKLLERLGRVEERNEDEE